MVKILTCYSNLFKNRSPFEDKETNKIFYRVKERKEWSTDLIEFRALKNSTINNLVDANMLFFSTTSTFTFSGNRDLDASADFLVLLNTIKNPLYLKNFDSFEFVKWWLKTPILLDFYSAELMEFLYFTIQKDVDFNLDRKYIRFSIKWLFVIRPITGLDGSRLLNHYKDHYFKNLSGRREEEGVVWSNLQLLKTKDEIKKYWDELTKDVSEETGAIELANLHGYFHYRDCREIVERVVVSKRSTEFVVDEKYRFLTSPDTSYYEMDYDPAEGMHDRGDYRSWKMFHRGNRSGFVGNIDELYGFVFTPYEYFELRADDEKLQLPPSIPKYLPFHPHRVVSGLIVDDSYSTPAVLFKLIKVFCQLKKITFFEGFYFEDRLTFFKKLDVAVWFKNNFFKSIWPELCLEFPASTGGLDPYKLFSNQIDNLLKILEISPINLEPRFFFRSERLWKEIDENKLKEREYDDEWKASNLIRRRDLVLNQFK